MLSIRAEQMSVFKRKATDGFAERLRNHLRTHYAESSAALGNGAELDAFVRRSIERAQGYSIQSGDAITAFAELLIQFGENFERSPIREWTLNILAHPLLPGYAKVGAIRERHEEQTQGRVLIPF